MRSQPAFFIGDGGLLKMDVCMFVSGSSSALGDSVLEVVYQLFGCTIAKSEGG